MDIYEETPLHAQHVDGNPPKEEPTLVTGLLPDQTGAFIPLDLLEYSLQKDTLKYLISEIDQIL